MTNVTVRFTIDTTGYRAVAEKLYATMDEMRIHLLRIALYRAKCRLHRAYLNVLRSTRRTRKEAIWRWELAKLHVRAAEIRVERPTAKVRIVSRRMQSGKPIVLIDAIYDEGAYAGRRRSAT